MAALSRAAGPRKTVLIIYHHERRGLGDAAPEIDNSIAPPRMEDARPDAEEVVVRVPSELGVGLPLGSILWPEG